MNTKNTAKNKGFTLIEVLVVIAIIAILAAIVLVAINPAKRFLDARQSQRRANVESLMSAIQQAIIDKKGVYADTGCPTLSGTATNIGKGTGATELDFSGCLSTYLAILPVDPSATGAHWKTATDYNTKYSISQTGSQIKIEAPSSEDADGSGTVDASEYVSVTR